MTPTIKPASALPVRPLHLESILDRLDKGYLRYLQQQQEIISSKLEAAKQAVEEARVEQPEPVTEPDDSYMPELVQKDTGMMTMIESGKTLYRAEKSKRLSVNLPPSVL